MAALDFPADPVDGQSFTAPTGVSYIYNAAYQAWLAQALAVAPMPPGSSMDYFGSTAPTGWYLCDGSLKERVTDAALFAAIGETYGAGDGVTTFAIPDCRGRVLAMLDGGTGRLTLADALGAVGGDQNMQAHAHAAGSLACPDHLHAAGSITAPAHAHTHTAGNSTPASYTSRTGQGDGGNVYSMWGDNAGPWTCYGATAAADRALTIVNSTDYVGAGAGQNAQPTMAANKLIKR
jgi:microcystin-dependent protein